MTKAPVLKPQDVLVACKLFSIGNGEWTFAGVATAIGLSVSEVHAAFKRCRSSQLIVTIRDREVISKRHFLDLLLVAVPRIFYAERRGIEKGMLTSVTQARISANFDLFQSQNATIVPLVWPDPKGSVKGESILPIYPTVPEAARNDEVLYDLLALTDVVRIGGFKLKKRASELLERKILGKSEVENPNQKEEAS